MGICAPLALGDAEGAVGAACGAGVGLVSGLVEGGVEAGRRRHLGPHFPSTPGQIRLRTYLR